MQQFPWRKTKTRTINSNIGSIAGDAKIPQPIRSHHSQTLSEGLQLPGKEVSVGHWGCGDLGYFLFSEASIGSNSLSAYRN